MVFSIFSYVNRKLLTSMQLQCVCEWMARNMGNPGVIDNTRVQQGSGWIDVLVHFFLYFFDNFSY